MRGPPRGRGTFTKYILVFRPDGSASPLRFAPGEPSEGPKVPKSPAPMHLPALRSGCPVLLVPRGARELAAISGSNTPRLSPRRTAMLGSAKVAKPSSRFRALREVCLLIYPLLLLRRVPQGLSGISGKLFEPSNGGRVLSAPKGPRNAGDLAEGQTGHRSTGFGYFCRNKSTTPCGGATPR